MPTLRIRTNNSQGTDVLVGDVGIEIPAAGGFVDLTENEELQSVEESEDLRDLLTNDAFGAGSSTLILVDVSGPTDVAQSDAETFLTTVSIPSSGPYSIPRRGSSGTEVPIAIHELSDVDSSVSGAVQYDTLARDGTNWKRRKNNATTSDPTVNSDSGAGYEVFSRWLNLTTDAEFVCLDATVGAAVWKETTAAGGGGSGDVTAAATLVENALVFGDTPAKGVKTLTGTPSWTVDANGKMVGVISAPGYAFCVQNLADSGELYEALNDLGNDVWEINTDGPGNGLMRLMNSTSTIMGIDARGDGYVKIGPTATAAGTSIPLVVEGVSGNTWVAEFQGALAGGDGVLVMAGEVQDDIAFRIMDADGTFNILDVHADNGEFIFGTSFAQANIDTPGQVYGMDLRQAAGDNASDFNSQNGVYRLGGTPVLLPPAAANPTPSNLGAGAMYYNTVLDEWFTYTGTKWLGDLVWDGAGRNGITLAGGFYRRFNGMLMSATLGSRIPQSTITRLQWNSAGATAASTDILVGGVVVATVNTNAKEGSVALDVDVSAGVLSFRNASVGARTTNFQCTMYYRRRAT